MSQVAVPLGVTVVIPHYGSEEPTRRLLGDLAAQRTERPVQVVVVDDASPVPFSGAEAVEVVHRSVNGGFGAAVNSGVATATEPLLVILNSDLRVDEDFVGALADAAERLAPAVVGPRLVSPDGVDGHSARRFPRVSHQVVEWATPLVRLRSTALLKAAVGYDRRARAGAETSTDWLVGAALCLPTEVFRRVGGFDERFFMNCEEVDIQLRLHRLGIPAIQIGSLVVTHSGGGSSEGTAAGTRRRWLMDSRRRYAAKWGGLRRLRVALTGVSVVNLAWNTMRRGSGRGVDPMTVWREERFLIWGPLSDLRATRPADVIADPGSDAKAGGGHGELGTPNL